jgi:hypothetical protein
VHKAPEGARNQLRLDKAPAVAQALKPVGVDKAAAVGAVHHLTLPRQTPATSARFFITGAGIWACCAARRKSI